MGYFHNPTIVRDGLVLYLDAANKRSYSGSGTEWKDLSINRNTGILTNGPTFDSGNGGSIRFDGVNDYTTINNVGITSLNSFSISFWAKKSTPTPTSTVYSEGTPSQWPNSLFIIYFGTSEDSGKCRVWFGGQSRLVSTTVVTDNKWYYVTYNQITTSNRSLYINSILESTNVNSISHSVTKTYLGGNDNNGNIVQFGNQNLGNIHCYNRNLSESEIQRNYNALKGRFGL